MTHWDGPAITFDLLGSVALSSISGAIPRQKRSGMKYTFAIGRELSIDFIGLTKLGSQLISTHPSSMFATPRQSEGTIQIRFSDEQVQVWIY